MTCDTSVSDYFLSYRQGRIILSQLVNFLVELRQNGYSLQLRDLDLSSKNLGLKPRSLGRLYLLQAWTNVIPTA